MTTNSDNQRVSDAYRDIARQTTRPELDDRILKLAASEARSRYGLARAWVRPLAWAATIALSLALVLQVTQDVDTPLPPSSEELRSDEVAVDEITFDDARDDADVGAVMKAKEQKDLRQEAARGMPAAAADAPRQAEPEPAANFTTDAYRGRASVALEEAIVVPGTCTDETRKDAADWMACITRLREMGFEDEANAELEALRAAFPDFREAGE